MIAFTVIRAVPWLGLLAWTVMLAANWTLSSNGGTTIGQCVLASQHAALAVMGYCVAKGLSEVAAMVEKAFGEMFKR